MDQYLVHDAVWDRQLKIYSSKGVDGNKEPHIVFNKYRMVVSLYVLGKAKKTRLPLLPALAEEAKEGEDDKDEDAFDVQAIDLSSGEDDPFEWINASPGFVPSKGMKVGVASTIGELFQANKRASEEDYDRQWNEKKTMEARQCSNTWSVGGFASEPLLPSRKCS